MSTFNSEEDVDWLPKPNQVSWFRLFELPEEKLVTSVFVFAFKEGRLYMMEHVRRGLDLPGGHVEPGELPSEAAFREFFEETGLRLRDISPFAAQRIDLRGEVPSNWRYPVPTSYQIFYTGRVVPSAEEINLTAPDSNGLVFLAADEVRSTPWYARHKEIFEIAFGLSAE